MNAITLTYDKEKDIHTCFCPTCWNEIARIQEMRLSHLDYRTWKLTCLDEPDHNLMGEIDSQGRFIPDSDPGPLPIEQLATERRQCVPKTFDQKIHTPRCTR